MNAHTLKSLPLLAIILCSSIAPAHASQGKNLISDGRNNFIGLEVVQVCEVPSQLTAEQEKLLAKLAKAEKTLKGLNTKQAAIAAKIAAIEEKLSASKLGKLMLQKEQTEHEIKKLKKELEDEKVALLQAQEGGDAEEIAEVAARVKKLEVRINELEVLDKALGRRIGEIQSAIDQMYQSERYVTPLKNLIAELSKLLDETDAYNKAIKKTEAEIEEIKKNLEEVNQQISAAEKCEPRERYDF